MHLSCLCPTYGRPSLVATAAKLFLNQRLRPVDTADLIVLDDADQIAPQAITSRDGTRTVYVSNLPRWTRLQLKYPAMQEIADELHYPRPDVYVIWDDDDLYLPHHLFAIAQSLHGSHCRWAHPSAVCSTYTDQPDLPLEQRIHVERSTGRFHGAAAVSPFVLDRSGGWCTDDAADYDQTHLARWHAHGPRSDYTRFAPISYVYRWGDTQRHHVSGAIQENRYRQPPIQESGQVDQLIPRLDPAAETILQALRVDTENFAD